MQIDLSDLTAVDFESLCYDLLAHLGLRNLQWRKGQNEGCSSSDNGRDIEGELFRYDIAGAVEGQRWLVECKHWKKAVPPTAIHNLFAWADAERPDVALIISSGVLSNSTHEYIETYRDRNRPPYTIKEWEQKNLAALLPVYPDILLDHGISTTSTSPLFLALWRDLKIHALDHLFALLAGIPDDLRDRMLSNTYRALLPFRIRTPESGKEKLRDLLIDPPSYGKFKRRCYELVSQQSVNEGFLVHAIVAHASRWLVFYADPYEASQANERSRAALRSVEAQIAQAEAGNEVKPLIQGMSREDHIDNLRGLADDFRAHLSSASDKTAENREILDEWEQRVLTPFLNEDQLYILQDFLRSAGADQ